MLFPPAENSKVAAPPGAPLAFLRQHRVVTALVCISDESSVRTVPAAVSTSISLTALSSPHVASMFAESQHTEVVTRPEECQQREAVILWPVEAAGEHGRLEEQRLGGREGAEPHAHHARGQDDVSAAAAAAAAAVGAAVGTVLVAVVIAVVGVGVFIVVLDAEAAALAVAAAPQGGEPTGEPTGPPNRGL